MWKGSLKKIYTYSRLLHGRILSQKRDVCEKYAPKECFNKNTQNSHLPNNVAVVFLPANKIWKLSYKNSITMGR